MQRYLADTHIVHWWRAEPDKLSTEQRRILNAQERLGQPVYLSAITLLEIAVNYGVGNRKFKPSADRMLEKLEMHPLIQVLPLTYEIATELAMMGDSLRDPMDRAIVATARVHRLTLITSDERIINSKLVNVIG